MASLNSDTVTRAACYLVGVLADRRLLTEPEIELYELIARSTNEAVKLFNLDTCDQRRLFNFIRQYNEVDLDTDLTEIAPISVYNAVRWLSLI